MTKLNKKNRRILEIIFLICLAVISLFLWDSFLLFPVKLITVFLHELSHVIATIITGGIVTRMDIELDLGGRCEILGGNEFIIASAGYLGSFLFGSILFYSAYSNNKGKWLASSIMIIIILFTVNVVTNSTIQMLSIIFSLLVIFSLWYLPASFNEYFLKSLGLISCLYVCYDIKEDILTSAANHSDATIIAGITGIPTIIWGLFWFAISIIGLFCLLRIGYKKG